MQLHTRRPAGQAMRRLSIRQQYNRVIPQPMGRALAGLGISSLSLLAPAQPACAMDFVQTQVTATEAVVSGRGRITPGDADRLRSALAAVPPALRLIGLTLDSPGGNVAEAKAFAALIRAWALPVAIPHRGLCASACFMLLAAAPRRLAAGDSIIGVHSAAENGAETGTSLAVTMLMARDA